MLFMDGLSYSQLVPMSPETVTTYAVRRIMEGDLSKKNPCIYMIHFCTQITLTLWLINILSFLFTYEFTFLLRAYMILFLPQFMMTEKT